MRVAGGSSRNRYRRLLALVSGTVVLFILLRSDTLSLSRLPVGNTCNPYDSHGFLNYNATNGHQNRWTPYDTTCKSPQLTASFIRSSWADRAPSHVTAEHYKLGEDFEKQPLAPNRTEWEDVEWARGRTVLVIGDSISRFAVKYFCGLVGESYIEIPWEHPWSPPKIDKMPPIMPEEDRVPYNPYGAPPLLAQGRGHRRSHERRANGDDAAAAGYVSQTEYARRGDWHKMTQGNIKSHRGHYCYVPGLDFLLVHSMFFGLDQTQYWADRQQENPPYTFEERMDQLTLPILERIRQQVGRTSAAPELTYVHSGLWDLARFTREDLVAGVPATDNLSLGRLTWYRTRVREILTYTARVLPKTKLKWLSTHYPLRVSNGWFFEGKRPEIKLNRLVELHQAAMSAFEDTADATSEEAKLLQRVGLNRWGLHMRGTEQLQIDDLHPDHLPGSMLFADMMLWDLREAVSGWKLPWS